MRRTLRIAGIIILGLILIVLAIFGGPMIIRGYAELSLVEKIFLVVMALVFGIGGNIVYWKYLARSKTVVNTNRVWHFLKLFILIACGVAFLGLTLGYIASFIEALPKGP